MVSISSWINRGAPMQALAGGALWLALSILLFQDAGLMGRIHTLLLLAVLVVVPLALALIATPDKDGRHPLVYRAAVILQPIAGAAVAASFFFPTSVTAALLAAPWALFTGLAALFGVWRLLRRGLALSLVLAEETCIDAALLYLPVGSRWLLASRAGAPPSGFSEPIVTLTAVHFHYAFFTALVLTGLLGRRLMQIRPGARPLFLRVAIGVIAGPPIVAAGLSGHPILEITGVVVLATSLIVMAVLAVAVVAPSFTRPLPRALLIASALPLFGAMALAGYYSFGQFFDVFTIDIPNMARLHGWANAAFAVLGLLAWHAEGRGASLTAKAPAAQSGGIQQQLSG